MKAEGKLTEQVREHLRHEDLLKPRRALTYVPCARLRLKLLNENKTIVLFFLFTSSELKSIFYFQFKPYATTFDNYKCCQFFDNTNFEVQEGISYLIYSVSTCSWSIEEGISL